MTDKPYAIYARVSRDDQNSEQQIKDLKDYARRHGLKVRSFTDHGLSGADSTRPKLREMLRRMQNGEFGGVLMQRVDRIGRDILINHEFWTALKAAQINLETLYEGVFHYDNGDDYFRFMLYSIFAERERMLLISRTNIGVARAKAEGKCRGGKKGRKWKKNMPS